eukprot:scaffold15079_cov49-Phaeocystis_antarctica.AAC.2
MTPSCMGGEDEGGGAGGEKWTVFEASPDIFSSRLALARGVAARRAGSAALTGDHLWAVRGCASAEACGPHAGAWYHERIRPLFPHPQAFSVARRSKSPNGGEAQSQWMASLSSRREAGMLASGLRCRCHTSGCRSTNLSRRTSAERLQEHLSCADHLSAAI